MQIVHTVQAQFAHDDVWRPITQRTVEAPLPSQHTRHDATTCLADVCFVNGQLPHVAAVLVHREQSPRLRHAQGGVVIDCLEHKPLVVDPVRCLNIGICKAGHNIRATHPRQFNDRQLHAAVGLHGDHGQMRSPRGNRDPADERPPHVVFRWLRSAQGGLRSQSGSSEKQASEPEQALPSQSN
jgi:hypothetical protein